MSPVSLLFLLIFPICVHRGSCIPCQWDLTMSTAEAIRNDCGYECENPWGQDDPYYCKKIHPCCCAPRCDLNKAAKKAVLGVNWNDHYMRRPLPRTYQFQILKDSGFKDIKTFSASGLGDLLRVYGPGGVRAYVGIPNKELNQLAADIDYARNLVRSRLKPFESIVAGVIVGNEPLICIKTAEWAKKHECGALNTPAKLIPAIKNVQRALLEVDMKQFVSSALNGGIMEMSKNPWTPCIADYKEFLKPILHELWDLFRKTNAPFIVNLYSWFAAINNNITPKVACGVPDGTNFPSDGKYSYYFNYDFQVDMNRVAMCKNNASDLDFWVGETGWPSSSHEKATLANAHAYVSNVVRRSQGLYINDRTKDTARFRGMPYTVFLFEAFNEEKKFEIEHGNQFESSFGLFYESGIPKWMNPQTGMLDLDIPGMKTQIHDPPPPSEREAES